MLSRHCISLPFPHTCVGLGAGPARGGREELAANLVTPEHGLGLFSRHLNYQYLLLLLRLRCSRHLIRVVRSCVQPYALRGQALKPCAAERVQLARSLKHGVVIGSVLLHM